MTDPIKAPELPASLPNELRSFVECTTDTVTIKDGPQDWVSLPDAAGGFLPKDTKPQLTITPGSQPATASIRIKVGFISAQLPASVSDGRLVIDTTALPGWAPASIGQDLQRFVDGLNAWFRQNGRGLAPPTFGADGVTLHKVPLAPPAAPATPPSR